jgi:hypothetical protein
MGLCVSCSPGDNPKEAFEEEPDEVPWVEVPEEQRCKRVTFPDAVVLRVHAKTQGRCLYCDVCMGTALRRIGRWEIEHYRPLVAAGTNDESNLFPSCIICNNGKRRRRTGDLFRNQHFRERTPKLKGRRCQFQLADGTLCTVRHARYDQRHCAQHRTRRKCL